MEPDKFEKHIKEVLEERRIHPSSDTWAKIKGQLNAPAPKKRNNVIWYSVAASFVGILIAITFYLSNKETIIQSEIELVDTPLETTIEKEQITEPLMDGHQEDVVRIDDDQSLIESVKKEPLNLPNITASKIALVQKDINEKEPKEKLLHETNDLIDDKIAELLEQVNILEGQDRVVTIEEVDSLLRKAQQEILTDKIFEKQGEVDAIALLNEVEGELDQTFREQIFETLKDGFLKVRTAVADRNN